MEKMIEEFLKTKQNAKSWLNTWATRKSIQGETIDLALQITEDETLYILKSGCSFLLTFQGIFEALGREATTQRIQWFLNENKITADSYQELTRRTEILNRIVSNKGSSEDSSVENGNKSKVAPQPQTKPIQQ